jgi:hypothetical protein
MIGERLLAVCLSNVGALTSHNPMGLHGLEQAFTLPKGRTTLQIILGSQNSFKIDSSYEGVERTQLAPDREQLQTVVKKTVNLQI